MKRWGKQSSAQGIFLISLSLSTILFVVFILPFSSPVNAQNSATGNQFICSANSPLAQSIVWALAITITVLIIVLGVVIALLGRKHPSKTVEDVFRIFFSWNGVALQIFTVGVVIFSTIFLASICQLSEGATAILSAITGFVLGNIQRGSEQRSRDNLSQVSQEGQNDVDSE